jgi:pseudouridine synthase
VEILPPKFNQNQIKITLYQGKKRQIRRMCSALHLHVVDLHRLSLGPINIGNLATGKYRSLSSQEIIALKK